MLHTDKTKGTTKERPNSFRQLTTASQARHKDYVFLNFHP